MDCQKAAEYLGWLGETYGFWIQTGAIVLSAFGAIAVIYNNSHQAKKRATIDLVLHEAGNKELIEAKKMVKKCHDDKVDFTNLSCEQNSADPKNELIRHVLNNYEFIASGIKEGAFDEEIYKRMKRSIILLDWAALEAYITELRRQTKREKLYIEFQWLAERWKDSQIKPNVNWVRRCMTRIGL